MVQLALQYHWPVGTFVRRGLQQRKCLTPEQLPLSQSSIGSVPPPSSGFLHTKHGHAAARLSSARATNKDSQFLGDTTVLFLGGHLKAASRLVRTFAPA